MCSGLKCMNKNSEKYKTPPYLSQQFLSPYVVASIVQLLGCKDTMKLQRKSNLTKETSKVMFLFIERFHQKKYFTPGATNSVDGALNCREINTQNKKLKCNRKKSIEKWT